MVRPYSLDLRRRVMREVESGSSVRGAAELYEVSPSFVSKLGARKRRTGSLAPERQGGDRRSKRIEAHAAWLLGQVATVPDLTLEELQDRLEKRGLKVAVSTIWRFLDR